MKVFNTTENQPQLFYSRILKLNPVLIWNLNNLSVYLYHQYIWIITYNMEVHLQDLMRISHTVSYLCQKEGIK